MAMDGELVDPVNDERVLFSHERGRRICLSVMTTGSA
jgi:hypothetical protein